MLSWRAFGIGIGRKRHLGFGHTDREMTVVALQGLDLGDDLRAGADCGRAVKLRGDGLNFIPQRQLAVVNIAKAGLAMIDDVHDFLSQLFRAGTAVGPMRSDHAFNPQRFAFLLQ